MTTKIALLSNVNMNFVIRMLQKNISVYEAEGYGNELGTLMNPASAYHTFAPEITFLVEDLMELLEHNLEVQAAKEKVDAWFGGLEQTLQSDRIYYISDAYLWGMELAVMHDINRKFQLEEIWQKRLEELCHAHTNVRIFPYRKIIEELGEHNAFSMKMWYMGRILHGGDAQKALSRCILDKVRIENAVPKKVLLLDLDNTLWGGLAGEADHSPIILSEDHGGLAYKNLQRMILQMQKQGVLLGIVSKNNEEDAEKILTEHPHMVLRPECFAVRKINWNPKHQNIEEIAKELNLGLDSFVFFDDNPTERELVKEMLPQVTVPDFPERPEELCGAMAEIYRDYFARAFLTGEDLEKTRQYAENAKRSELQKSVGNFEEYLKQLRITLERVNACEHTERLTQLINKTNQFNLTTRRYTQTQVQDMIDDCEKRIYLYRVADRFGDNGIVAVVIVNLSGEVPEVTDFVMSCRVMGKNIEDAILEDVEQDLSRSGYKKLRGSYLPTAKNKPVASLYERMGYRKIGTLSLNGVSAVGANAAEAGAAGADVPKTDAAGVKYELIFSETPKRVYYVEKI